MGAVCKKKWLSGLQDERVKRDGKDWGEGRKRVEDGATEAEVPNGRCLRLFTLLC